MPHNRLPFSSGRSGVRLQVIQLFLQFPYSFRACELGLENEVRGMELNSKLGVYKQEWQYQACLVFNPNPNVYY